MLACRKHGGELPLLDEPVPPSLGRYSKAHTKKWAAKIATFAGFVFVTPEYNHGTSGALKNALDLRTAPAARMAEAATPKPSAIDDVRP